MTYSRPGYMRHTSHDVVHVWKQFQETNFSFLDPYFSLFHRPDFAPDSRVAGPSGCFFPDNGTERGGLVKTRFNNVQCSHVLIKILEVAENCLCSIWFERVAS